MRVSSRASAWVVMCTLHALACGSDGSGTTLNGSGTPQERIVLPAVLSLTGSLQSIGQEQLRGVRIAEQQLNAAGGLFGKPVELRVIDDRSDPAAAGEVLAQLKRLGSPVVAGISGSDVALALRDAEPESPLVYVTPGATSPLLTDADPNRQRFFRTAPTDTAFVPGFRDQVANVTVSDTAAQAQTGCFKFQALATDDSYGRPITAALTATLGVPDPLGPLPTGPQVKGVTLVPAEMQSPSFYDALVTHEVSTRETYCQLIAAAPPIAAELIRAIGRFDAQFSRSQLARSQTIGFGNVLSDEFIAALRLDPSNPAAGNLAEGILVIAPDLQPAGTQYNALRGLFQAQFGAATIGRATTAYDSVIVAALALEVAVKATGADSYAGTPAQVMGLTTEQVRRAVLSLTAGGTAYGPDRLRDLLLDIRRGGVDVDYVGASGNLDESPSGEVTGSFVTYRVQGGQFERLSP